MTTKARLHILCTATILVVIATMTCIVMKTDDAIRVYQPRNPTREETASAKELARVLNIATGRPVKIAGEPLIFKTAGFYVGDTSECRKTLPEILRPPESGNRQNVQDFDQTPPISPKPLPFERWDNIGWACESGRVSIAGSDSIATGFAVSRFLEEECDARWWMPGDIGEDIPKRVFEPSRISRHIEKPSYVSRDFIVIQTADGNLWKTHNAICGRISMNHALHKILGRDVANAHPEWFPPFDGKSFDPASWKGVLPHPNFANPEVARYVAQLALDYFDAHPESPTFSISPADTSLFGDVDNYAPLVDPKTVFRSKSDLSNALFTFDNRVAELVARKYPDRYLGALAYALYENVPDFPVESNIIPFMTADRSQWYDKSFRAEDLALTEKWAHNGPRLLGTFDYYYGSPYVIPRVMLGCVEESIPALRARGLRAFFADGRPMWGFDAPKRWIASHLLWDSDQSPKTLENEFFDGFFGPASEPMHRFFAKCDEVWMNQKGSALWIKYYADADQSSLFDAATIAELRDMLNEALAIKNLPEKYLRRVRLVSETFTITERTSATWRAWEPVARWTPDRPIAELTENIQAYGDSRSDMDALNADTDASGTSGKLLYGMGYLTDDDPLAGRLAYLRGGMTPSERNDLAARFPEYAPILAEKPLVRLLGKAFGEKARGNWTSLNWPSPLIDIKLENNSLFVAKANSYSTQIDYRAVVGRIYCVYIKADGVVSPESTVCLLMKFYDESGKLLSFSSDRLPSGRLERAFLAVAGECPENATIARVIIIVKDQVEGDWIRLGNW